MTAMKAMLRNYKPMVSSPYMQIILTVPAEEATHVISTLGYPTPGESLWVGVARIEIDDDKLPPFLEGENP